jgi:ubiquinone/menaquinone biosynthesis C-methylase UbiE
MSRVQERIIEPEILDSAGDEEAARNLKDITRINTWTGARRELIHQLRQRYNRHSTFCFLDVGAASGDLAKAVRKSFPNVQVHCLDLLHRNLNLAPEGKVQGDAFRLPFRDHSVDVVHCSLFLHHFPNAQAAELTAEMTRVSRQLVLIQDLHRHWISYYFLPATSWCFGWNDITVSDGMKSVAAGWRRPELENLLKELNLQDRSRIRWHFPSFRFFIAIDIED